MSLRTRLMVGLAVLVLAAVASAGWSVLRVAYARTAAAQEAEARAVGGQLTALLEQACVAPATVCDGAALQSLGRSLVDRGALAEVVAVDDQGRALCGAASDPTLASARAGVISIARGDGAVYYYAPLHSGSRRAGAVRLKLPGADDLAARLHAARSLLVGVTLFDGGLVLLFGALFIRRVVGPLAALSGAARRVAAGELDLPPLSESGGPPRHDELSRLIADFNRMTASLRQQRDHLVAQERLVTVGQLAAGVAHEIGNPLAAVLGFVDLLLHDEAADSPRRDSLERIRRETERIRGIVADLLDYSRPTTGTVEPLDLGRVLDGALALLQPQARFRGITVERRLPPDLPPVAAALSRVTQILLNLLFNAADAMDGEGRLTIDAAVVGPVVELRLADSGPGVAAADRSRIFDPFFTTKEPGKGTGLGLSISRSIAEAYGGTLTLEPSDAGAIFVLRLPRFPRSIGGEAAS
jgi:signal transduction histidine kinase